MPGERHAQTGARDSTPGFCMKPLVIAGYALMKMALALEESAPVWLMAWIMYQYRCPRTTPVSTQLCVVDVRVATWRR